MKTEYAVRMLFVCLITAMMSMPVANAVTIESPPYDTSGQAGGTADKTTGIIRCGIEGVGFESAYVGSQGPLLGFRDCTVTFSAHLLAYIHGWWGSFSGLEVYIEASKVYNGELLDSQLVYTRTRLWTNDVINDAFMRGDVDSTATMNLHGYAGAVYFVVTFKVFSYGCAGVHLDSDCDSDARLTVYMIQWDYV